METVIVGGGHAGLVASWHLQQRGVEHVVLEASRIGESWRTQRWDSFALNTPTWMNRLPGDPEGEPRDGFGLRDEWVTHLTDWTARHALPVREGVRVTGLRQDGPGFRVSTSAPDLGDLDVRAVIVASGMQRIPRLPPTADAVPSGVHALHAADYRSPGALPPGGVIVVGSAQSGGQIAEELLLAGRRVVVAASAVARQRRRYRGRDTLDWLRSAGFMDQTVAQLPDPRMRFAPPPIISGVGRYGHTLSLQGLVRLGAVLTGRLVGFEGTIARFGDDLAASIRRGDAVSADVRARIDAFIAAKGIDAPPPDPDDADPDDLPVADPDAVGAAAPRALDLAAEGIGSIIWATGFGPDVRWMDDACLAPGRALPEAGAAGVVAGIWFLGIPWQSNRASAVVWGADPDAAGVADALVTHLAGSGTSGWAERHPGA